VSEDPENTPGGLSLGFRLARRSACPAVGEVRVPESGDFGLFQAEGSRDLVLQSSG